MPPGVGLCSSGASGRLRQAAAAGSSRGPSPPRAAFDFKNVQLPGWLPLGKKQVQQLPPAHMAHPPALLDLLDVIQDGERGLAVSKEGQAAVRKYVAELQEVYGYHTTTRDDLLSANWELLYTTERETLWILENAHRFGTRAGPVYQVIDVRGRKLQNVITFPPQGMFVVDSSIEVSHSKRVDFKFTGATLKTPDRVFKLPPFGKGWFENVYVDLTYRVAVDIRGDVLVCKRAGPPQRYMV